jgi:hypothetical protein
MVSYFYSGAKILADIIQELATKLISSTGGKWEDITAHDASAVWNISNKTADNARRALVYNRGGAEQMFFTMEAINAYRNVYYSNWHYGKGLRLTFASSWDSVNHTFASDARTTLIPFEMRYNTGAPVGDLAVLQLSYFMWVEESNGNGFVLTAKPEPNATDDYQCSFFIATERVDPATHEYSVGNYGWYCFNVMNIYAGTYATQAASLDRMRGLIRPGLFHFPRDSDATQATHPNTYGLSYGYLYMNAGYRTAFKSTGNGKIYYIKPVICNSVTDYTPAFQAQLFFPYDEGLGLMDGDIIAVDGSTVKYICKALDSPDSINRLPYAMKYSQ